VEGSATGAIGMVAKPLYGLLHYTSSTLTKYVIQKY
jgi:hypothetical protein